MEGKKEGQMKEAVVVELSDPVTQSRPICPELVDETGGVYLCST